MMGTIKVSSSDDFDAFLSRFIIDWHTARDIVHSVIYAKNSLGGIHERLVRIRKGFGGPLDEDTKKYIEDLLVTSKYLLEFQPKGECALQVSIAFWRKGDLFIIELEDSLRKRIREKELQFG